MANLKSNLKKTVSWIDSNILLLLSTILVIFIPLYPKLPLFEAIPGYIVRVRLEDIFVLLSAVVWFNQVLRKKTSWNSPLFKWIVAYGVIGLLSTATAVFITKSVPSELLHFGKTLLHFFRYMEYFSLFLIVFSSVKTKKDVKLLISATVISFLIVTVYGYGQKFYYWPVYSTMNREFSKGVKLYLTEHARVQSTFGGHYDLGAYIVLTLPVILALSLSLKNKKIKFALHATHLFGLWLMLVSASRISFFAYFVGCLVVILLIALNKTSLKMKIKWGLSRAAIYSLVVMIMFSTYGSDIYERFLQVLEAYPVIHDVYHETNRQRKEAVNQAYLFLGIRQPAPPASGIAVNPSPLVPSDQRPTSTKPRDVYVDVPVPVATTSASGSATFVDSPRQWSDNAIKYGLSIGIRLDTLWPNAIKGFMSNPVFGKGYATLNKEAVFHFTEAESTDNNFLRTLGETGLAGFISFYGIVAIAFSTAFKLRKNKDPLFSAVLIGFIGATLGVLINATYIDVFASSKVAFAYWAMTGIVAAISFTILKTQAVSPKFKKGKTQKK